jgi:tetratricopeptide (TPR) repeat protein
LAILITGVRTSLAPPDQKEKAHHEALKLLSEAENFAGVNCAIWYARQTHAAALGLDELAAESRREAEKMAPRNASELVAAGRALWEAGRLDEAWPLLDAAIQEEPQSLWANLCLGRCSYDLGRFAEAANAFTACIALEPNSAWCYQNRALALVKLGKSEQARRDFDQALKIDPFLAAARLNRGRLNLEQHRWKDALADFDTVLMSDGALTYSRDAAAAYAGRAAAHAGLGDMSAAQLSVEKALEIYPGHREALSLQQAWTDAGE